ncbi:MAG: hypothetical protein HON65_06035 [Rhodospirillales bacterium]|jgi:hypothetical protein|nr:hypothetical protein [Rhodospirillales bacterium]
MHPKHILPLIALFALALNGCALAVVEGTSAAVSGKTVSDHIISFSSGKDCSTLRIENNQSYCVEDEVQQIQQTLYCYKTLAAVSCYTEPDPSRPPDQIIGQPYTGQ